MDDAVDTGHGPRSRSVELARCSLAAAIDRAEPPLWVWRAPDGTARLGTGEATRVVADGEGRFGALEDGIEGLTDRLTRRPGGPGVFIGSRFDAGASAPGWDAYPPAVATVPSVQLAWTGAGRVVATVVDVDPTTGLDRRLEAVKARFDDAERTRERALPAVTDRTYEPTPATWREDVATVIDRLDRPPLRKAVLAGACRLDLDGPVPLASAIEALIERHPACWVYAYQPEADSIFLGATPERLASLSQGRLETVALAGSIRRGDDAEADAELATTLLEREDRRREQASVVGDIVRRLGPLSTSIRVDERRVRRLTDVQHLETPIRATIRSGVGLVRVAGRLHPTPAVGGQPRASALATIDDVERIDRGWYAAPIGVLDPSGAGTLAVGIRSARIDGTQATLYAGNGIVAASDPEAEWGELLLKFQPMERLFDD